jgi:hypothetical protein
MKDLHFEELEVQENLMSEFWQGFCAGFIFVGGILVTVAT